MPGQHTLMLPLPPTYATHEREHFSFLTRDAPPEAAPAESPSAADPLTRYLDDLCDLLLRTRLIQRHPDKYFQYVRGEKWRCEARHLDGSAVTQEELDFTNNLCDAFAPLIDGGEGSLETMRVLLREGPPLGSHPSLVAFHAQCRALMLHRVPRPDNDSARFTLLQRPAQRTALARQRSADAAHEARRREILQLVLSYGMNAKKQHEVVIMRDTIRDLVDCTNIITAESAEAHRGDPVRSVVNVGEGKGYVSRALALCDGLHVVGLDCNPAHRERAMERFETLVESSLSLRPGATHSSSTPGTPRDDSVTTEAQRCGKDMIALRYEPRGNIASIACRVDASTDWRAILQGHTPVVEDGAPLPADVLQKTGQGESGEATIDEDGAEPGAHASRAGCKGECKVCQRIFPLDKTLVVLKHIHRHCTVDLADKSSALSDPQQRAACGLPTDETLAGWHRDLPQVSLQEKLVATFFAPVDVSARRLAKQTEATTLSEGTQSASAPHHHKRQRVEDGPDGGAPVSADNRDEAFTMATVARGLRVTVLTPWRPPTSERTASPRTIAALKTETTRAADTPHAYQITTLTVIGRDDATGTHFVIYDAGVQKERCVLVKPVRYALEAQPPITDEKASVDALVQAFLLPPASAWAAQHKALLLRVHEPYSVTVPAVRVPSLSNTAFIGLHTCGDLGANTCRLFVQNRARGLLLVSCCWQALTNDGFPLSRAFRDRGMTTDKVSLLLATQPLDMWATASPEGHRSSARLLFFRTLLIMLWATLREEWERAATAAETPAPCTCPFAPEPHLEPGFLRRLNKVKTSVSFPDFAEQVCGEYIYAATAKCNAYTWHSTVCERCRLAQENLFHARVEAVATALAEEYVPSHFPPFLGLTVLRMWMCHLLESLFLLDRALYLHEELATQGGSSTVSLVPLFDGALSPRMYGILALRDATQ